MNDRIRELAKEALDYAEKNQSAEVQQHWFKLYNEKFAELIVRECAKSANYWYQNHNKIHSDPMSYVLAHFGVEE
jgi:1,2-phenylacetyl-CoA epoxidase catalytic subunit